MTSRLARWVIVAAAVSIIAGCSGSSSAPPPTRQDVSSEELQAMIEDGQPLVVLDVRDAGQYDGNHIPDSINIPLLGLEAHLGELDPAVRTVCICQSGVRSRQAAQTVLANGFTRVYNLEGGLLTWDGVLVPTS